MNLKLTAALSSLALLFLLMAGCQKEELTTSKSTNGDITVRTPNCATDCIDLGESSEAVVVTADYNVNQHVYITIYNDANNIYYSLTSNVGIFYVKFNGTVLYCNGGVNPKVPAAQPFIIPAVALGGLGACDIANATIVVDKQNCNGGGEGHRITVNTSYSVIGLCQEECDIQVGQYATYTQGFYMSAPPGLAFMTAHWAQIGPGVSGGCGSNAFSYSSPAQINALQPGNSQGFGFRNQLITLIINARTNANFGCLRVASGTYAGKTVDQIIALANTVGTGGGCVSAPAGLGALLDALNNDFHEGLLNNGVLTCCSE